MAVCWFAKEAFASIDLLCTVEHLIFIITSNLISSELNINGGRPKKPPKQFFISLDGNHFLLFFFQCLGALAMSSKEQYMMVVPL